MDEDFATNVAVDQAGDIYVVGRTDGAFAGQVNFGGNDAFVRKYSNDGEELWTYQFGSRSGDNIKDIILDDAGSLYAVGRTNGVLAGQESKGLADAFLIKLSTGFSPPPAPAETAGTTGFCSSIGLSVSGRLSPWLDAAGPDAPGPYSGQVETVGRPGLKRSHARRLVQNHRRRFTGRYTGRPAHTSYFSATGTQDSLQKQTRLKSYSK